MQNPRYKAIFFDLDGTLLPMDLDEFLTEYFTKLNAYAARAGMDAQRFSRALSEGVKAMATDTSERTNEAVFWDAFHRLYGNDDTADARIMEFYDTAFPHIGDGFQPNPAAARAVNALRQKGYPLFLTTMPLFPRVAVEWRLRWAGVDVDAFQRITTYDNSFACKPDLRYYRQNIQLAGCDAQDILMVGNNTVEDLSIMQLGCDAYLVTDFLLDPAGFPIHTVKHGSLADFADFAEQLPAAE